MGDGPYYVVQKPFHLCHLEVVKTLRQVVAGAAPLLGSGQLPRISVAALAKRDLQPGETIARGMGSFDMRGEALRIAEHPGLLPIGLAHQVKIVKPIAAGSFISLADVELPESLALTAWLDTERRVLTSPASI